MDLLVVIRKNSNEQPSMKGVALMGIEALLDLIRCSLSDWPSYLHTDAVRPKLENILEQSQLQKIFPLVYSHVKPLLPDAEAFKYDSAYFGNVKRAELHLKILGAFEKRAESEYLRTVLVKGISLSKVLYGDFRLRQCGDIDLLVDTKDLAKCDYVLRECGFSQPPWITSSAKEGRKIAILLQEARGDAVPYPHRRKTHDCQLAPYYLSEEHVKVEIHDGFRLLPEKCSSSLLWNTQKIPIGESVFRTLRNETTLLLLCANTFQNSETFYAAKDSELCLRDYLDVRTYISRYSDCTNWEKLRKTIYRYSLENMIQSVFENYKEIFGHADDDSWKKLLGESSKNSSERDFLKRLSDKDYRNAKADASIKSLCRYSPNNRSENPVPAFGDGFDTDALFRVGSFGYELKAIWSIPHSMADDLNLFCFQVGLVPHCATEGYLELVAYFYINTNDVAVSEYGCFSRMVQVATPRPSFGKIGHKVTHDKAFSEIELTIPYELLNESIEDLAQGIGVFPVIFQKNTRDTYSSIRNSEEEFTKPIFVISPS